MEENRISCAYCSGKLPPNARYCPRCGRDVSHGGAGRLSVHRATLAMIMTLFLLCVGFGAFFVGQRLGYSAGVAYGLEEGERSGYSEGYTAGNSSGIEQGKSIGRSEGSGEGYRDGYRQGKKDQKAGRASMEAILLGAAEE